MLPMTLTLDHQMEEASEALAKMDYLHCEVLCVGALAQARQAGDWAYYGRILLPLQECRRQRRMIAAEGTIRLGTGEQGGGPSIWLEHLTAGCLVITHPHTRSEASRLLADVRQRRLHVEIMFADCHVDDASWRIITHQGHSISIDMPAPAAKVRDRWLIPLTHPGKEELAADAEANRVAAADWFIDASEKLGDALLAQVGATGGIERITALEACIEAVPDHELLHQALANAARTLRLQ